MKVIPYASAVGSHMYVMLCTRSDICYVVGMVARYQSNPGKEHWVAVKGMIKYLKRTWDCILIYKAIELVPFGYMGLDFQTDNYQSKSTSCYVFTLGGGAIAWRNIKHKDIADSTMEAEYVAAFEATKEIVCLRNFLLDLSVVPYLPKSITIYCDNFGARRIRRNPKPIRQVSTLRESTILYERSLKEEMRGVVKIAYEDNLADPFTKELFVTTFNSHVEKMGVRCRLGAY